MERLQPGLRGVPRSLGAAGKAAARATSRRAAGHPLGGAASAGFHYWPGCSRLHILAGEEVLKKEGIDVWEVDRGGDVTYHGPGQIVVYPILDLRQYGQDLHVYVRSLEEAIIRTVGAFGVPARREAGLTGVWTDKGKIAAIGIGVKGWVSIHGIALNVRPNMQHFQMIVPCGISNRPVAWLAQWQENVVEEEVQACLLQNLADVLGATYEEEAFHETAAAGMAKNQGA